MSLYVPVASSTCFNPWLVVPMYSEPFPAGLIVCIHRDAGSGECEKTLKVIKLAATGSNFFTKPLSVVNQIPPSSVVHMAVAWKKESTGNCFRCLEVKL